MSTIGSAPQAHVKGRRSSGIGSWIEYKIDKVPVKYRRWGHGTWARLLKILIGSHRNCDDILTGINGED